MYWYNMNTNRIQKIVNKATYCTRQKKLNGSNGTCNFGDGNITLLQSSTTRELLERNLNVTSALHDCYLHHGVAHGYETACQ